MTDTVIWLISASALLLGCWLQTLLGFGMAIVASPVIVLLKPEWVPVVVTLTALPLSAMNAWNQRDACHFRAMLLPLAARIPGTAAGVWLLLHLNTQGLQILVAVCVLFAVAISFLSRPFAATPARLGCAGFVSGITGTTTSIGGPPMALVMQHGKPRTVRANLSLYFTWGCIISLAGFAAGGMLTRRLLLDGLSFIPCVLVGFLLGLGLRKHVDAAKFRIILILTCTAAAVLTLAMAVARLGT